MTQECCHHKCNLPANMWWVSVQRYNVDPWYFCHTHAESFMGKVCRGGDIIDFNSEEELEVWLVMHS